MCYSIEANYIIDILADWQARHIAPRYAANNVKKLPCDHLFEPLRM